jgi:hypothetical protein
VEEKKRPLRSFRMVELEKARPSKQAGTTSSLSLSHSTRPVDGLADFNGFFFSLWV